MSNNNNHNPNNSIIGSKVIIVGGGLAGLSAAHTVLERGGRVLVLDKKNFPGGNRLDQFQILLFICRYCIYI